jgi:hypothetical protein
MCRSATRIPAFGHAVIDFLNATHAAWKFLPNAGNRTDIADPAIFIRNPEKCDMKRTSRAPLAV